MFVRRAHNRSGVLRTGTERSGPFAGCSAWRRDAPAPGRSRQNSGIRQIRKPPPLSDSALPRFRNAPGGLQARCRCGGPRAVRRFICSASRESIVGPGAGLAGHGACRACRAGCRRVRTGDGCGAGPRVPERRRLPAGCRAPEPQSEHRGYLCHQACAWPSGALPAAKAGNGWHPRTLDGKTALAIPGADCRPESAQRRRTGLCPVSRKTVNMPRAE